MSVKTNVTSKLPSVSNTDVMIADKLLRMQLADARKAKHITQKQLSEITGLSESCISNIENGEKSSPTLRSLIRYASAVGVDLHIGYPNQSNNVTLKEEK